MLVIVIVAPSGPRVNNHGCVDPNSACELYLRPPNKICPPTGVHPTPSELKKAKADLSKLDKKELKSRYQSLSHFLKCNPDEAASSSRGSEREQFLHIFLAHQMRAKSGTNSVSNVHKVEVSSAKQTFVHEWSQEQMDKELGDYMMIRSTSAMGVDNNPKRLL